MFPSFSSLFDSPFLRNGHCVKSGEFNLQLPKTAQQITFTLIVSQKRKSISLQLKNQAISVRCPHWVTHEQVLQFIRSKERWLLQKLNTPQVQLEPTHIYRAGSKLMFDGQLYRLVLTAGSTYRYHFDEVNRLLTLTLPSRVKNTDAYVQQKLIDLYRHLAQNYAVARTAEIEQQMGLKCSALEFKLYKRRWGCCYSSGLIRINPMIMGAPKWVVDCVITHELSHLVHMNHSKAFWQLNKQHCTCCDESKAWLKRHGCYLQIH